MPLSTAILDRLKTALAGRYEVIKELARGGMGQVFEAQDLRHRRPVAIKVLDPALAAAIGPARFRAEIETAARLAHPHIVPLFDSGEAESLLYYVMPLIAGESLRRRIERERQLPVEDAVAIAREVADALHYAHVQGLVHRDVKPENILLSGGHALVLDFGIACTLGAEPDAATRTVAAVGTAAYMSPEQIAGASFDGRTDQYSLACVLYETLTGQPPFTGPTADNVILQHRSVDPRPATALRPATPPPVAEALTRALAKSPADRYATIAAFSAALSGAQTPRARAGAGGTARLMLAVLPLENLSADPEQEYFTDGMTEELITQLARRQPNRLGVIARTSAMRYKRTQKSIAEIGRELAVEYVVEGTVRRAGDRVRIAIQLVQVLDQGHVWAETYDRRMADIFELQDEVAGAVAKALEVELVSPAAPAAPAAPATRALQGLLTPRGAASAPERGAAGSQAYECYLKGRFHWNKRTPEALRYAIEWFERAIQADPRFARAYAGLADVYNNQVTYMMAPGRETMQKAERAASRALELDPDSVEAHTSLSSIFTHTNRFDQAEQELRRALEIDPNYLPALYWGAVQLSARDRYDEGLKMIERAHVLDPLSVTVELIHGNVFWAANREAEAAPHYLRALELEPKMPWLHMRLALCRAAQGRLGEALDGLGGLEPTLARTLDVLSARAHLLGRLGRREEATIILRELEERSKTEYVSWERYALAYVGLDERDKLHSVLTREPVVGLIGRMLLLRDAAFEPIRRDPRFDEILKRCAEPG